MRHREGGVKMRRKGEREGEGERERRKKQKTLKITNKWVKHLDEDYLVRVFSRLYLVRTVTLSIHSL
jgi:hypothetical protein